MAASIILDDIRLTSYDCATYPSPNLVEIGDELVPDSLTCFIHGILNPRGLNKPTINRRCTAIAHAIIASCRPRSFISPLLLAIAVYIHRKYASRELIDILSSLNFCVNYREVQRYEYAMINCEAPSYDLTGFVQFVFDNADFNVNTLNGKNKFHSMGGIACMTPGGTEDNNIVVPRNLNIPSAEVIGSFGNVPLLSYCKPSVPGLQSITIVDLTTTSVKPQTLMFADALDTLWLAGYLVEKTPRTSWSGYMQVATSCGSYDKSRIEVLPFINLDPTKPSTIYTALHFAQKQCERQGKLTCPVTFDQPLYIKAAEIVAASEDLGKVFIRLGGFHLIMSYMGSIGNIMSGSGLEELWESVYAKDSVVHMMSGRAYSRALRVNFLTQVALLKILIQTPGCMDEIDKDRLCRLYKSLLGQEVQPEEIVKEECVKRFSNLLHHVSELTAGMNRTSKLWIQYYKQVAILRMFIRAERTSDWQLHIYSIIQMLPHFHAAGHLAYAKSAHLYIQQMLELPHKMPVEEYKLFTEKGYFTIRRTDKFWDGIFSDQTIEQFLMRQLKSSGGMTHGRGITESALTKWVHALGDVFQFAMLWRDTHQSTQEHLSNIKTYVQPVNSKTTLILVALLSG